MINRFISLFSLPSYALLFMCMALQGMGISLSTPFLSIYFTEQLGVSIGMFGLYLAVTLIAGIWISTLIGRRSDLGLNRKSVYLFLLSPMFWPLVDTCLFKIFRFCSFT